MTTPTDYTPSPAMVEVVAQQLYRFFGHEGSPGDDHFINAAEQILIAQQGFLSDPKNAEDAKAWAEATMEQSHWACTRLHWKAECGKGKPGEGEEPLYRVRSEP